MIAWKNENTFLDAINARLVWKEEETLRVWNDLSSLFSSKLIEGLAIDCGTFGYLIPVKHIEFLAQKKNSEELFLIPPYIAVEFYLFNTEEPRKLLKGIEQINLKQLGLLLVNRSKISVQQASFFVDVVQEVSRELIHKRENFEFPNIGTFSFQEKTNGLFLIFEAEDSLASAVNKPFACFPITKVKDSKKLGKLNHVFLEDPEHFNPWNKICIQELKSSIAEETFLGKTDNSAIDTLRKNKAENTLIKLEEKRQTKEKEHEIEDEILPNKLIETNRKKRMGEGNERKETKEDSFFVSAPEIPEHPNARLSFQKGKQTEQNHKEKFVSKSVSQMAKRPSTRYMPKKNRGLKIAGLVILSAAVVVSHIFRK